MSFLINRAASDALMEMDLNVERAQAALVELLEGHFRYGDLIESEEEALAFGASYAHYRVIADIVVDYIALVQAGIRKINECASLVEDPDEDTPDTGDQ